MPWRRQRQGDRCSFQRPGWSVSEGCVAFVIKKLYIIKAGRERPYSRRVSPSSPCNASTGSFILIFFISLWLIPGTPKCSAPKLMHIYSQGVFSFHWIGNEERGGEKEVTEAALLLGVRGVILASISSLPSSTIIPAPPLFYLSLYSLSDNTITISCCILAEEAFFRPKSKSIKVSQSDS